MKKHKIPQFHQLIVSSSGPYTVKPLTGVLERLGREVLHPVTLSSDAFFYTLRSECEIETDAEVSYVTEGNMLKIFELTQFIADEVKNNKSKPSEEQKSSFVLKIIGQGRSTLCKTLTGILSRLNFIVQITEYDPSLGFTVFPGVIGLTRFNNTNFSEPEKLCYFFGNEKIENQEYYDLIKNNMERMRKAPHDIEIVLDCQDSVQNKENNSENNTENSTLDLIIVSGDETRFHLLQYPNKKFVPCHKYVKKDKNHKIREYFYGSESNTEDSSYTPVIINRNLKIVQVGEQYLPPLSALPIGQTRKTNNLIVRPFTAENGSVIGISHTSGSTKSESFSVGAPVKGFIMCVGENQWMTVQKNIEKEIFIGGNIMSNE